jgi:hypothetical protein
LPSNHLHYRVKLEFSINAWAAHGPGLPDPAHWLAWAADAALPRGEARPELTEMPAMLRRRLNGLGRLAVQVAYQADAAGQALPVVLGSRHGDATRSLDLLADLARGEAVSPTAFGLSVHNAVGAMYSIARGDHANFISVAAGRASAAACLVEAAALLAEGAPEVLVVCYDAPLPGAYAAWQDEPAASYGWAWRVGPARPGHARFALQAGAPTGDGAAEAAPLPFDLDVLRFFLSGAPRLTRSAHGTAWTWSRLDA